LALNHAWKNAPLACLSRSGISLAAPAGEGGTKMSEEQTELRFLTLAEAAIILQVSKRTILRMIQKKEVPALKVGGQWRLRESQLRRWAEEKENVVAAF
jgi:excisionase family DNA binding protein